MPVCEVAVKGGVLAHWRDEDAILEGEAAECERSEELGCGCLVGCVDGGS